MGHTGIALYSLDAGQALMARVAGILGVPPAAHEERDFEDGEHKIRPLASVENRDVFFVQSLAGNTSQGVNDQLVRSLFFLAALKDEGANSVHAVIPYLCYARKDRRTKPHDPVTLRYVAQLIEAVGVDSVTVVDVHNRAAFENAFRCRALHLTAADLFVEQLLPRLHGKEITVASPDIGGVKRADLFRVALQARLDTDVGSAFMEKHRSEGVVSGEIVAGDIEGKVILLLDDLIAGGTTMRRAAEAFCERGAEEVIAIATHGLFGKAAVENLVTPAISHIVVTDSVSVPASFLPEKLSILGLAPLIAAHINGLHAR